MTNNRKTKRTLLYSALALILCFTMLLGTTFAWFTDTASTAVNKIQAGTLDIELLDKNGDTLEGKTLSWQKAAGHEDEAVLWEPGASYDLEAVTIKNIGNLALKYKIVITGIDGDAKLNEVIDWTVEVGGKTYDAGEDISLAAGASNVLTISGKMQTTAGNEYQGLSIDGVAITVYATQDTVEYDSTTNQYDKDAEYEIYVSDIDELRAAIESGEANIVLADDIEIDDDELEVVDTAKNAKGMFLIDTDTVIDLNGKTLAYTGGTSDSCWYIFYVKNATLTIIDSSGDNSGTVYGNDPDGTWAVMIRESTGGTVNIYGGHYMSKDGAAVYTNDGDINIYGGIFETEGHTNQLLYMGNYSGSIRVYGGTYKNYNPATNAIRNIKVADGYKVTQDGDWYTVVED